MKTLASDRNGLSEIVMILLLIIGLVALLGLIAGGFTLVAGIFFGGKLGLGFGLLVFGFILLGGSFLIKAFAKAGLYLGIALIVGGIALMVLGALGL